MNKNAPEPTFGKWNWYWRTEDGEADCGVVSDRGYSVCRAPRYQSREQWEVDGPILAAAKDLLDACQNAREIIATDRQAFVDSHRLQDNRTEDPIAHGLVAVGDGAWLESSDAEALREYDESLALIDAAIAKATGEKS